MLHHIFIIPLFAVISVPEQIAEKMEPSDDSSGPSYIDYSERRSLPISIPDYQSVTQGGDKFVVSTSSCAPSKGHNCNVKLYSITHSNTS